MLLGEALKFERKKRNLSQTEMAAGVISTAFYSKVERGEYDLDTMKLLAILEKHGISATNFIQKIAPENKDKELKDSVHQQLLLAYSKNDLREVLDLEQFSQDNNLEDLYYLSLLLEKALRRDTSELSDSFKQKIKKMVFENEEWDKDFLKFITNLINALDIKDVLPIISKIVRRYKNISEFDQETVSIVSQVLVNFLATAYLKKYTGIHVKQAIELLKKLPEYPENCFAKIMANYYYYLFTGDKAQVKAILQFLRDNDLAKLAKRIIISDKFEKN